MSILISREVVLNKIAEIDKLSKAGKTDEALALMKECFESLSPSGEWISVKKHGNPTMSDDYWVTIQYPTTRIVEKVFFSYEQNKWYYVYSDKILAWQKIEPSPYKGE